MRQVLIEWTLMLLFLGTITYGAVYVAQQVDQNTYYNIIRN